MSWVLIGLQIETFLKTYLLWHSWFNNVTRFSKLYIWSVPKVMRMILLHSAEGPGKESGSRSRWRGNSGIQFDLSQLGPRLCSSRYFSKMRNSFCVLSRAKMQRSLEQRYAIKFWAKLGKSGSERLQLLRTAYGDAVFSSSQVFRCHMAFKDGR